MIMTPTPMKNYNPNLPINLFHKCILFTSLFLAFIKKKTYFVTHLNLLYVTL